ncbi:AcrR family transcriptional regulator [Lipingzhangella halophila]|uniref:AcrR family transcriptional regulator n=1 Tax=Lipingzhangella halophila TaxID=1783352 RepID=A0A7W7RN31_9ACTN|nr:TetR/AcrR family transcriptional regulator [Lipingzhangella halophila]MBB4934982.1 AcrR family transcriptional regulator [Lipingzhangella halophila]
MAEEDVPAELGRLWRLSTPERLGRPAELDVDRVVRAAVDLADRDGLAGVTLSKVAKALGFTAMSLYRHVGSKDELVVLMEDHASGPPPDLGNIEGGWRAGLREWALRLRAVHDQRPWLAHAPLSGPPSGPNAIGWLDAGLRTLRDTGLGWGEKTGICTVLSGYVRHTSLMAQQLEEGRRGTGLDQAQVEQGYGRALARFVQPDRFPEAAKLFASGVFEPPANEPAEPGDPDFTFGLGLILDGVAAAIDAAREPAAGSA